MSIVHPIATEKSIRLMEAENKLIFQVERQTTKAEVKEEIETLLEVKVAKVNTLNTLTGKKAIVTFAPDTLAIDVATKLGLM